MTTTRRTTASATTVNFRRRLITLALALAVGAGLLVVAPTPADAATMYVPTLDCFDGGVHVKPGIRANYGDTDGYYRVDVYRASGSGWVHTGRYAEGRVSTSQMSFPSPRFYGLGRGQYAVGVQRWDIRNGRWVYLGMDYARQVHWMSPYYTSATSCWL